ncbi:MAG TPA: 4-hydroxybenzoate 3-monooxygenase [Pseudorhodoplanes sp.]|nr:4-hydroxybenzoate 3-monooxygenase [Pseudorhodoplanes sp.]
MRTQVGIVGAGPAGLMLSHLLHLAGIETVIVEARSRSYCEQRVRAGLMENWAADLLIETGVGERLQREGLVHRGIKLSFDDALHHIDFQELVGKTVTVYGQQEVVKDLIARRLADGTQILFEADEVSVHDFDGPAPKIRFRHQGERRELSCDFIGGCDGFHGICRPSIPAGVLTEYERVYPFGWLGIIGEAPPVDDELVYAYHARGFALFSMRSPSVVRYYLQCAPDENLALWPDGKIWAELKTRLGGQAGERLVTGKILEKGVTAMRSFVCEPMQYGRLFLAGDAAHIVPPTGAKGMNLALADVRVLAGAISEFYASGRKDLLGDYSRTCLRRIWKAQRFSWWMTQMLHRFNFENDFDMRRQLAEIDYVTSSRAAMTALAENYAGLPID